MAAPTLPNRPLEILIVVAVIGMVVGGLLFFLGPVLSHRAPSRGEIAALRVEGSQTVRALDDYKAAHGRYPDDLPASAESDRSRRYGGWKYSCNVNCTTFTLSIGDYGQHSFTLTWDTTKADWRTDS